MVDVAQFHWQQAARVYTVEEFYIGERRQPGKERYIGRFHLNSLSLSHSSRWLIPTEGSPSLPPPLDEETSIRASANVSHSSCLLAAVLLVYIYIPYIYIALDMSQSCCSAMSRHNAGTRYGFFSQWRQQRRRRPSVPPPLVLIPINVWDDIYARLYTVLYVRIEIDMYILCQSAAAVHAVSKRGVFFPYDSSSSRTTFARWQQSRDDECIYATRPSPRETSWYETAPAVAAQRTAPSPPHYRCPLYMTSTYK